MLSIRLLILAYKCFYSQAPEHLISLFEKSDLKYNLRRKRTFILPRPRTDYLKKSISFKAISLWNHLDNDVRAISDLNSFKNLVKKMSFNL